VKNDVIIVNTYKAGHLTARCFAVICEDIGHLHISLPLTQTHQWLRKLMKVHLYKAGPLA